MMCIYHMMSNNTKTFCCTPCGYFCNIKSNLAKHFSSKKHISKVQYLHVPIINGYKCNNCDKTYKSNQGLWGLKKKCQKVSQQDVVSQHGLVDGIDLLQKIDNLERVIGNLTELVKNQQPSTIMNNNNNNNYINNNNNYINVFLNDKCKNAYDIKKFIESIDFSKEDFEKLIMNYVDGNAEIIEKNYKSLPEFERPIYCFEGEDKHQKIAHIHHENEWMIEPELSWERQVQKEQDEVDDNPAPNSMYSFVRLFDKKKMEHYDKEYKNSHLYLKQRKFNRDCLDGDNQVKLINKIIDMATIATDHRPQ